MSDTKKSPRRKPPPPLNDNSFQDDSNQPTNSSYGLYIPQQINQVPSVNKQKRSSQLPPLEITVERALEEYGDTTYDELILNYSTVRARGPVELPPEPCFLSEDILPHDLSSSQFQLSLELSPVSLMSPSVPRVARRKSLTNQKIQNIPQGSHSPIEVLEPNFVENLTANYSQPSVSPELINSLPYPLEDDFVRHEISPDTSFYNEIKESSQVTPNRIPTLTINDPLHRSSLDIPKSDSFKTGNGDYYFMRSSPPLFQASFASSPELPTRSTQLSASSSPTRTFMLRNSVDLFSTGGSRSSPSTSPKKENYLRLSDSENELLDIYDDCGGDRYPEWSLIEHDETDYYDEILEKYLGDAQFDFSVLPELPKVSIHRKTSSDALSSFISKQIPPQPVQIPIATAKKFGDLPPVPVNIPTALFTIASLSDNHFQKCAKVWSLSEISRWCLELSSWMDDQPILYKELEKGLTHLLVYHKPDLSVDVIERNLKHLMKRLMEAELISSPNDTDKKSTEVVFYPFNLASVSGVLVELCSCYCIAEANLGPVQVSCYSHLCPINKRIAHENFMSEAVADDIVLGSDWASHWNLTAQEISIDATGSKKQSFLFDLIKFEQTFLLRANCFIEIAGPEFIKCATLLLGQSSTMKMLKLKEDIFDSATKLSMLHYHELLTPLKSILITDGKFIRDVKGMAELYYAWSKKAKKPLLQYMSVLPTVEDILSNETLKGWDLTILNDVRLKEQQVNGNILLISTFNSRYQQLPLQLLDIRKFYEEDDEEFAALTKAIDSIKELGTKVNEMKVFADNIHLLKQVEKHLSWKPSIKPVNLKLSSPKRKFYFRGDLLKKGDLKIHSYAVHVIILDNYILITERQRSNKVSGFKVTETPIPVEFLLVENRESDSLTSIAVGPVSSSAETDDDSSFPFKIRYAGRGKSQSHTLIAKSEADRRRWLSILLQSRHGAIRKIAPMAPFNIESIDDSFFAYDMNSRVTKLPLMASNDPLLLLSRDTREHLKERKVPADLFHPSITKVQLLHHQISYSETFTYLNERIVFLGLNAGIFCSDGKNIWKRIVNTPNVTKISVIPELSVVLVLANKELRYYPLKSLIDMYYERKERVSSFLLTNSAILFYEYGRHREVPTVFVARKKSSGTTTFKVFAMETDNHGIFSTFSVIKRFYIQADCYGISIFNTSIAVHTNRGFEILDLDKLVPRTVPELPPPDVSAKKLDVYSRKKDGSGSDHIRKALAHTTPMGMFKLTNNKEFLLVYTDCAIFVNKNGKLSRKNMIFFDFRPRSSALINNHLVLVCEEVAEVWSISDFTSGSNTLVQVLPAKDLHMTNKFTFEFQCANPKVPGLQLLFRLVPSTR